MSETQKKMEAPAQPPITGVGPVTLTHAAVEHVKKLMERDQKIGSLLRVSVVGGGCSGLSYKMAFEAQPAAQDQVAEFEGLKVIVDPRSSLFLKGIEIDYVDGLDGSGFTYNNPNAKRSCGCGTSFSA